MRLWELCAFLGCAKFACGGVENISFFAEPLKTGTVTGVLLHGTCTTVNITGGHSR